MLGGGREGAGEDGEGGEGGRGTGAKRGGKGREEKEGVGVGRRRRRHSSLVRCLRAHRTKLRTVNDSVIFGGRAHWGQGDLVKLDFV